MILAHVNWQAVGAWMALLNFIAVLGLAAYTRFVSRSKATQDQLEALGNLIGHHAERLGILESERRHAPTHHDLGKIYNQLNGATQEMAELRGTLAAVKPQLALVSEHLLEQARRQS